MIAFDEISVIASSFAHWKKKEKKKVTSFLLCTAKKKKKQGTGFGVLSLCKFPTYKGSNDLVDEELSDAD